MCGYEKRLSCLLNFYHTESLFIFKCISAVGLLTKIGSFKVGFREHRKKSLKRVALLKIKQNRGRHNGVTESGRK